jgi:cyclic pyranopterin phosphate synthase
MVDITNKSNTLRIATAQAIVKVSDLATLEAIKKNVVPPVKIIRSFPDFS